MNQCSSEVNNTLEGVHSSGDRTLKGLPFNIGDRTLKGPIKYWGFYH